MRPGSITLSGPIYGVAAGHIHTVGLKSDGTAVAVGQNVDGQANVSGWTDIAAVSSGEMHTVGLKSDGTAVAVGHNGHSQLNVSGWTDIKAVSAGGAHTVGLKSDGTVIAVGNNDHGQLAVSGWADIATVSAGYIQTVGLKSDGTVVAVGNNDFGQLDVSDWTDISAVSAGHIHTVGLKSDGTVVAVGNNDSSQLEVSDWTDITAVSAGGYHTVGLKSDGTVVAVGHNGFGQLDVSDWTDITAVSAGGYHTVGLKSDGTVVAVGHNGFGQLNVSGWAGIPMADRTGVLGGSGTAVGLRAALGAPSNLTTLTAQCDPLGFGEAVKIAVRVSDDGVTWSEPLGSDGLSVDWTSGSGTYFGRAAGDSEWRGDMSALRVASHVDLVVRLESAGVSSPEVHSLTVSFQIAGYDIVPTAGPGGSISPDSTQTVTHGSDSPTFTITPDAGYRTADVTVDGVSVGAVTCYKFMDVTAPHTIEASFVRDPGTVSRITGADRFAVAAALARKGWDPTGTKAWPNVEHVIVVNGENGKEADALSAAGLAGVYDCPVLTVAAAKVPAATKTVIAEIAKMNPKVQVHMIGGTASVPDARWNEIKAIPGVNQTKDRIAGPDRYSTSAAIANRMITAAPAAGKTISGSILIAGDNPAAFYDALAASPIAYAKTMPMLSVKKGSAPPSVNSVLNSAALRGTTRYAASGSTYIGAPASGATRLTTSSDRYLAAAQIGNKAVAEGFTSPAHTGLAAKLPDALVGGAYLGKMGGAMLFTDSSAVIRSASRSFISANKAHITNGWVIGGVASVPSGQETDFRNLLK